MADSENIILRVESQSDQVETTKKRMVDLHNQLKQLNDAFSRGAIHGDQFRAEQKALTDQLNAATQAMNRQAQATHQVNTASAGGAGGMKNMGMAAMQAAYFMDDMQYGLKGVVNNIPMLLSSMGLGMGLTGVVSIAAVGVNVLVGHLKDLEGIFGDFGTSTAKSEVEQLTERVEKLDRAWIKSAQSARDLINAQSDLKNAKAAAEVTATPQPQNVEAGEAFGKALKELGGGQVESLVRDYVSRTNKLPKTQKELIEQWRAGGINLPEGTVKEKMLQGGPGAPSLPTGEFELSRPFADIMTEMRNQQTNEMLARLQTGDRAAFDQFMTGIAGNKGPAARRLREAYQGATGQAEIEERIRKAQDEITLGTPDFDREMEAAKQKRMIAADDKGREAWQRERQSKISKYTGYLQSSFNAMSVDEPYVNKQAWTEKRLRGLGVGKEEAAGMASDLTSALSEGVTDALPRRAGEQGLTERAALQGWAAENQEKRDTYNRQVFESQIAMMMRQEQVNKSAFRAPEHIAAQDVTRKIEAAAIPKSQLDVAREQLQLWKEMRQYIQLIGKAPKLGK